MSSAKNEWNGMVVQILVTAILPAAPSIVELCRKDTTINPKEFNQAPAILKEAKKSPGNDRPAIADIFCKMLQRAL